jgi:hypothetical protein
MNSHKQNTYYILTLPFLPSLKTLHITIQVHPCDTKSLHSYIANHAHCAIRRLWATYTDQPIIAKLETFSLQFWRWENPSSHPDEDGVTRDVRLNKTVFNSVKQGSQLVVRSRDERKTITTTYNEILQNNGSSGLRVRYVATHQT